MHSVLVYPSAYVGKTASELSSGLWTEGEQPRGGESWRHGPVVLTWDHVRSGAAEIADGHNIVFHEFAHQLDEEEGPTDGTPALGQRSRYIAWAKVLGAEYDQLRRDVERHRLTLLDEYGATKPWEFFAVATECFFEKPLQLQQRHPEMYDQLKEFYRQDPVQYFGELGKRQP